MATTVQHLHQKTETEVAMAFLGSALPSAAALRRFLTAKYAASHDDLPDPSIDRMDCITRLVDREFQAERLHTLVDNVSLFTRRTLPSTTMASRTDASRRFGTSQKAEPTDGSIPPQLASGLKVLVAHAYPLILEYDIQTRSASASNFIKGITSKLASPAQGDLGQLADDIEANLEMLDNYQNQVAELVEQLSTGMRVYEERCRTKAKSALERLVPANAKLESSIIALGRLVDRIRVSGTAAPSSGELEGLLSSTTDEFDRLSEALGEIKASTAIMRIPILKGVKKTVHWLEQALKT